ncbi:MAG: hypothetical protein QM723_20210 [Myxococcaceae bacterium]
MRVAPSLTLVGACAVLAGCPDFKSTNGSFRVDRSGGTMTDARGLTLTVPPGAVTGPVTIIAEVVPAPPSTPGVPVTPAWHLQPDGLKFATPATLSLSTPANDARLVTAPDAVSAFERVASSVADGKVTASIAHFSIFVGVVDDAGTEDAGDDAGVADSGVEPDAGVGDGGEPDGGGDDGGAADAGPITCGTPIWDGGATVACSSPSADAGQCSDWNPYIAVWGFGANRNCEGGGQSLDCSSGVCWCSSFDRQVAFPMVVNDPVCIDLIEQIWECTCGYTPPRNAPIDCSLSLNGWDGGLFSLSEGSACTDGNQCEFGVCLNTSYGQICSKVCSGDESQCGCGFRCVGAYPDPHAAFCMP